MEVDILQWAHMTSGFYPGQCSPQISKGGVTWDEIGDVKPVEYGEEVGCDSKHGEKQERLCVENGS